MNLIRVPNELKTGGKRVCLAIGFFDGVHLGHQQIIRQTIADARQHDAIALVLTFDKHPNAIVAPEKTPPLVYSLEQKLRAIESLGVEHILLIAFDKPFSRQTGEGFIRGLARDFGKIHSICVGADFVFGHKRGGNVALLKELGGELHFHVHGLSAVALDGQAVSSTRIREAIRTGNLDDASQMLGRPYAICGKVITGDKRGRDLGFPTANLDVTGLVLPPNGVYAAITRLDGRSSSDWTGKMPVPLPSSDRTGKMPVPPGNRTGKMPVPLYRVALNIGNRPTVAAGPRLQVEAHLLDFEGDLYGQELEIEIGDKLREEKKFESLEELKGQIARDVEMVRGGRGE